MQRMLPRLIASLWVCAWFTTTSCAQETTYDVVIYGGTSAAVTAAVQAQSMGKTVIVVSPDRHLGGLSSGGLGWTDSGNKAVIGGLARQFYHRVWKVYQNDQAWRWQRKSEYGNKGQGAAAIDQNQRTMWIFEPHVAEQVFDQWVADLNIPVVRQALLDRQSGVVKRGERIESITTLAGNTYRGKMFIDATYEGDLMAAAGVSFHVGREARSVYDEKWNGVQTGVLHHGHWFNKPIDPYVVPGDASSGLVAGVSSEPPGEYGSGDHRVQAYCFRMCLTQVPENRVAFPKPPGYDPKQYELLGRVLDAGWNEVFHKFDPIPNLKTDTNNHGPFSTDHIGGNYDYPQATYERRREIIEDHRRYQQGLMYYLANDPRVPEEIRREMSRWGLAKDEFTDNGHWPHQIYVREARRMKGAYVMTEHDCLVERPTPQPIGMGSYTMDSHNVQRYVKADGFVQNEGDIGVPGPPYQIAYGSIVPEKSECSNLLVPVAVSASHIAYGSIRMEPVFMILGQSAASAAAIALDRQQSVQDVSYDELKERLVADGQVLEYSGPSKQSRTRIDPKTLPGIVIDTPSAQTVGAWTQSGATGKFIGSGYLHDNNESKGTKQVSFSSTIPSDGTYDVRLSYAASDNRAKRVPVTVRCGQQSLATLVDQSKPGPVDDGFVSLGKILAKANDTVVVTISNHDTQGYVIADAVMIVALP